MGSEKHCTKKVLSNKKESDRILLRKLRREEETAFFELYRRYHFSCFFHMKSLLKQKRDFCFSSPESKIENFRGIVLPSLLKDSFLGKEE
jgi:hypothetical protein